MPLTLTYGSSTDRQHDHVRRKSKSAEHPRSLHGPHGTAIPLHPTAPTVSQMRQCQLKYCAIDGGEGSQDDAITRLGVGVCLTGKSVGPDWCESGSLTILQCEWCQRQALTVEGGGQSDVEHEALVGVTFALGEWRDICSVRPH
jgi:hypothetical protein